MANLSIENCKMCSREELRQLLYELLCRLDYVAYLAARTQFKEECNIANSRRSSARIERKYKPVAGNKQFENILRFQRAYVRYFVFAASDPYTEFIVPLTSNSLALFITNILSRDGPMQSPTAYHTSRTIIEFLQVCYFECYNHVVENLRYLSYQ